jgi:hypothetical protein
MNAKTSLTLVAGIAAQIANIDFRTAVSCYTSRSGETPWTITVGESNWQRHLRVLDIAGDGTDATLGILQFGHYGENILNVDEAPIEQTVTLKELIELRYPGVKKLLGRDVAAAA